MRVATCPAVAHAQYVEAFHTTGLFRLVRWILRLFVGRPSTDIEARAPNQVLLRDFTGRTCSWLMVTPAGRAPGTRLYFGSVVIPSSPVHARLLGFHTPYSLLLLRAAARRLG